ncbi:MAG TPA: extracellular solute-binding protein, partial [Paenibacillus sp.]|nr:extracellular solute-binding protein [Paenibacillus sp.]
MKKSAKSVSLVLIASLMAASLAACSASNNSGDSETPSNGAAPSDTAGESNSSVAEKPAEKPELKVLLPYAAADYNTSVPAQILEEKTGYKVRYDMLPQDRPMDKLNIVMASGEAYDAVSIGSVDKQLYYDYAQRGALTDLTPLIEQYGPNIKAAISQASLDAVKVDGKIYSIPTKGSSYASWSVALRQDWLEKLNLQMPTTLDELVAVLKAFKEQDPGGNGDRNIPLVAMGDVPLENIRGAFGMAHEWSVIDGKLVNMAEHPALKEYIGFVSGLLKDGLLDKEFVTTKEATMLEKFSSGQAGAMIGAWFQLPTISEAIVKNNPGAKITFTGALAGKDGKAGLAMGDGFELFTFVPKSSEHPEEAIKWINERLDPETFKNSYIGLEGTHHTLQDGAYNPINPKFSDEFGFANNMRMGVDEKIVTDYWQARVKKNELNYQGWKTINSIPEEHKARDP